MTVKVRTRGTLGGQAYYFMGTPVDQTMRVHGNERLLATERHLNQLKGPSDKELEQLELELERK
ncbi:hypothetical protein [uncultured Paraglaciecola sp.]|uniref:hypothetical protein n=1 Tax=uncultured Paraglaciecola sp. TaxID=1765024 RepID=UPI0026051888|nr:hypothetical protein [uncultured Paraglaciecola sp.]